MDYLIPGAAAAKAAAKAAKKVAKKKLLKEKKMRQPTKKELKKGKIAGKAFGGQRALTPGDKEGEMIYSRPDYKTGKTRVQVTSGVEGGRGKTNPPRVKPTPSKGQIHSAANRNKIAKAATAADERSARANRDTIKRNETIGQQRKRKQENEAIDKGLKTIALKHGSAGKGGTYPPTQTEIESELLNSLKTKTNPPKPKPKPKPKEEKKMGGGKVYKYGQGGGLGKTKGKRISKNETNGNKIVADCYKNYV
tara:strand:+ start:156 stop:908 length:753 start_codon:yes stop_codon:yes gene_type:complete